MSPSCLRRILIYLFNFFNILSCRIDGSKLKNSFFLSLKNFLMVPALLLIRIFIPIFVHVEGLKQELEVHVSMSVFVACFISSLIFIYNFVMGCCIYIQLWNREKIIKLANKCVEFHKKYQLDGRLFQAQEKKFFKNFLALLCLIVLLYYVEFISYMNPNWQGLVVFLLYQDDGFIVLFFLAFTNCFLYYFTFLVKALNLKLKISKLVGYRMTDVFESSNYLIDLHNLIAAFKDSVGTLLSFVVVFIVTANVIRVTTNYLIGNFRQFYFHFSFTSSQFLLTE